MHLLKHLLWRDAKLTHLGIHLLDGELCHKVVRQLKSLHKDAVAIHHAFHLLNEKHLAFTVKLTVIATQPRERLVVIKKGFGFGLDYIRFKKSHDLVRFLNSVKLRQRNNSYPYAIVWDRPRLGQFNRENRNGIGSIN